MTKKQKVAAASRAWKKRNPERVATSARIRKYRRYGLSVEEYDRRHEEQGHRCAICQRHQDECVRRFNIDHCHEAGHVRGLLCLNCNTLLGKAKDSIDTLNRAVAYLSRSGFGQ